MMNRLLDIRTFASLRRSSSGTINQGIQKTAYAPIISLLLESLPLQRSQSTGSISWYDRTGMGQPRFSPAMPCISFPFGYHDSESNPTISSVHESSIPLSGVFESACVTDVGTSSESDRSFNEARSF